MGIDPAARRASGKKIGRMRGNAGVWPFGRDRDRRRILGPIDRDLDRAAARDRRSGEQEQVEEELHLVLRQEEARRLPDELGLLVLEIGARDPLRGPRSMLAPAEPAAPKARRANCSREEARAALSRTSLSASARIASSFSMSMTSSPLTIAPTGLMTSWQTRLHKQGGKVERFELDVGHLTVNNLANPVQNPLAKKLIGLDSPSESGCC